MKTLMAGLALGASIALAGSPALSDPSLPPDVLPYAEIRAGMIGTGMTVFHGEKPEPFDVEILGTLDRIGPGQNLILGKLSGTILAGTGVLEGMSGSPVYVQGKMIGAVSYSWGFAKEAIAGITPIEEMLRIPEAAPRESPWSSAGTTARLQRMAEMRDPQRAAERFDTALPRLVEARRLSPQLLRLDIPLAARGISQGWLSKRLSTAGGPLRLTAAGGSSSLPASSEGAPFVPLSPGDAVGASLVQGDIDLTAYGTVTRVDGERVLAFGHPFLQLGPVELPMTRASIVTLLPSLSSSFKIASSAGAAGVFYQDRATGISGRLGARPRMVPVRLEVQSPPLPSRSYAYQVVADPLLTPILLYLTLGGVLEASEKVAGEASIELKEGSVLIFDKNRKADVSNLFAGEDAIPSAAALVGVIAEAIVQNEFEPVRLEGVNLVVAYSGNRRQARITGAWTDKNRVRPGESVLLTVGLEPYREAEILETIPIEIPEELPPGGFTIHIGDARSLTRVEQAGADGLMPLDLGHLLDLVNTLRKNRSLAVLGTREEPSVVVGSEPLPNLPPSKSSLLLRKQSRSSVPILRVRPVLDESRDTDYAIEGYRKLEIEVVR